MNQRGSGLFAEYGQDYHNQGGAQGEQEQQQGAKMYPPVCGTIFIRADHPKCFHQANHDLGAREKRAGKSEQKPFPRLLAGTHKILGDDVFAAGRHDHAHALRNLAQGVMENGFAAQDSEDKQQGGKKCQEHIEGDGLAKGQATGKDAPDAAKEVFEERFHRLCLGIIRVDIEIVPTM